VISNGAILVQLRERSRESTAKGKLSDLRRSECVDRSDEERKRDGGNSGRRYLSTRVISRGGKREWEGGSDAERASRRFGPRAQSPPKPRRERFVVVLHAEKREFVRV